MWRLVLLGTNGLEIQPGTMYLCGMNSFCIPDWYGRSFFFYTGRDQVYDII